MAYVSGQTTIANFYTSILVPALTSAGWTNVSGSTWSAPGNSNVRFTLTSTATSAITITSESFGGTSRTVFLRLGTNSSTALVLFYQIFIGNDYLFIKTRTPDSGNPFTSNAQPIESFFGITTLDPYYDSVSYDPTRDVVILGNSSSTLGLSNPIAYVRGNSGAPWIGGLLHTMRPVNAALPGIYDGVPTTIDNNQIIFWPYIVMIEPNASLGQFGGGLAGRLNNIFYVRENSQDLWDSPVQVGARTTIDSSNYRSTVLQRESSAHAHPLGFSPAQLGGPVVLIRE